MAMIVWWYDYRNHQHNSPCAYFLRIGFTSFNCPLDLIEFFYCVSIHTHCNTFVVILVQTCIASANNSENVINVNDRTNEIANKENFGSCTNSFIQTIRKLATKYLLPWGFQIITKLDKKILCSKLVNNSIMCIACVNIVGSCQNVKPIYRSNNFLQKFHLESDPLIDPKQYLDLQIRCVPYPIVVLNMIILYIPF